MVVFREGVMVYVEIGAVNKANLSLLWIWGGLGNLGIRQGPAAMAAAAAAVDMVTGMVGLLA